MSFEEMMNQLRGEYLDALPNKITDIEAHFQTGDVSVLREDFHKLKGTGRTYGIPEISLISEVLERICVKNPDLIGKSVPIALELLREIHLVRTKSKTELPMETDARFISVQAMING